MPELTVLVPLGGREVEMRKPTDGALVVLARITRTLPNDKIENDEMSDAAKAKLIRNLGTLGQIVESMIVKEDDLDFIDEAMIEGSLPAEEIFDAIRIAGEKFNGTGSPAGPAKKAATVRRRAR